MPQPSPDTLEGFADDRFDDADDDVGEDRFVPPRVRDPTANRDDDFDGREDFEDDEPDLPDPDEAGEAVPGGADGVP